MAKKTYLDIMEEELDRKYKFELPKTEASIKEDIDEFGIPQDGFETKVYDEHARIVMKTVEKIMKLSEAAAGYMLDHEDVAAEDALAAVVPEEKRKFISKKMESMVAERAERLYQIVRHEKK